MRPAARIPHVDDAVSEARDTVFVELVCGDPLYFARNAVDVGGMSPEVEDAEPAIGDPSEKETGGARHPGNVGNNFSSCVLLQDPKVCARSDVASGNERYRTCRDVDLRLDVHGQGGYDRVDVPNDQAGVTSDFVETGGEVVGVGRTEGERVAGAGVANGESDGGTTGQDGVWSGRRRFETCQIDFPGSVPYRDEIVVGLTWVPRETLW